MRWRLNGADGATGAKALTAPSTHLVSRRRQRRLLRHLRAARQPVGDADDGDRRLPARRRRRRAPRLRPRRQRAVHDLDEPDSRAQPAVVRDDGDVAGADPRRARDVLPAASHGACEGGHASAAVPAGARDWFLAEGSTGDFFEMFVLISNPNSTPVTATIRYLTPHGRRPHRDARAAGDQPHHDSVSTGSRAWARPTCRARSTRPATSSSSARCTGRACRGRGTARATASASPALRTRWGLAEGETGGADGASHLRAAGQPGGHGSHRDGHLLS